MSSGRLQAMRKDIEQLKYESSQKKIPVSESAKDLKEYCLKNDQNDYLMTKVGINPFKTEKFGCPLIWRIKLVGATLWFYPCTEKLFIFTHKWLFHIKFPNGTSIVSTLKHSTVWKIIIYNLWHITYDIFSSSGINKMSPFLNWSLLCVLSNFSV